MKNNLKLTEHMWKSWQGNALNLDYLPSLLSFVYVTDHFSTEKCFACSSLPNNHVGPMNLAIRDNIQEGTPSWRSNQVHHRYSTYYSQLIRFFRLCNNINDFLFRAKFSYSKLVKRGYKHNLLLKYFKKFCSAFNIEGKYGEKNSDLVFSRMLKHNPFVSCNIKNTKEINDIVKASCVKIMPLTRSVECEWKNKSPLPTNVSDTVNAPPPPPPPPLLIHWI